MSIGKFCPKDWPGSIRHKHFVTFLFRFIFSLFAKIASSLGFWLLGTLTITTEKEIRKLSLFNLKKEG